MPITAADVHATQFRVVFRGYDIRSVDAFLDEVEHELERLGATDTGPGERSAGLVARSSERGDATDGRHATGDGQDGAVQPNAPVLATAAAGPRAVLDDVTPAAQADGRAVPTGPGEADVPARAIRTLRLAEQMADQLVASAVAEADQIQAQAADEVATLSARARELEAAARGLEAEARGLEAEVERLRALDVQIRERVESLLHAQLELVRGDAR